MLAVSKLRIAIFFVIVLGLAVAIYLIQTHRLPFFSRAGTNFVDALEIKNPDNSNASCDTSVDPPVCVVNSQDLQIRVRDLGPLAK